MPAPPLIVIRADASATIGGGHVMRCLSIAEALAARGAMIVFATGNESLAAVPRLADGRFPVQGPEPFACDVALLDGYDLGIDVERAWAGLGAKAAVLDDAPGRPHDCMLLIDAAADRRPDAYDACIGPDCRKLLGPAYAPMSPRFAALRSETFARRAKGGTPGRALVSMGLADVGGLTLPVVRSLLDIESLGWIDVAVGAIADSVSALATLADRTSRLHLHIDAGAMAELTAAADIGVGAAGVSTWERCALGLPSVVFTVANNQNDNARALEAAGAAIIMPEGARANNVAFNAAIGRLLSDDSERRRIGRAAAGLCDGLGAERIADALIDLASG